jgi:transposase
MQVKKQYTDEFKRDAIRLLEMSGKTVTEVENELGVTHGLLRKWQKRFQVNPVSEQLELSEVEQLKAELRSMKRELEMTRMERDILKKTVGIFSKDSRA